jgi:nitrous oxidase accessory protein
MMRRGPDRTCAIGITAGAFALVLLGAALPLWSMTLHAPQYINGLRLVVDGRGVHGDVDELNALNHYIGMPPISEAAIPEARFFYPAVAAIIAGIALLPFAPWRLFRGVVSLGSWALPLTFLADLQWHLYRFGHSLDPQAAFRLPAFTPRVIGSTVVMNFNVTALPGLGVLCLLAGAFLLTVGPRMAARWRSVRSAALAPVPTMAVVLFATAAVSAAVPAGMPADAGFDLTRAIAQAPPGAVISIPPGIYPGPVVLSKPVTLRGRGRAVIDGGRRGDVVVVTGNDVHLEGLIVRGSALAFSAEAAGIVVRGARAVVRDNRIDDVLFGIYLAGARDAVIEGNHVSTADLPIERRGHAVYLWRSHRTRLRDNRILRGKDGIYVSFSDDNLIEGNTVTGCRYGLHYMYASRNTFRANVFHGNVVGAAVMYSTAVTLDGNTFEGSRLAAAGAGLIFKDVDRLLVRGNRVVRNRIGLEFDNTPATIGGWARVEHNLVAFNAVGFNLMSTAAILATENTVVENLRAVQARGAVRADANRWASAGRGNHWGDYAGFDASGDGIGDISYRRTDLLEDLTDRAPALEAFLFTPAHLALEAAARLAPLVRLGAIVEDPTPLMRPSVPAAARDTLVADRVGLSSEGLGGPGLTWTGLALLLPALAALLAVRDRGRWP